METTETTEAPRKLTKAEREFQKIVRAAARADRAAAKTRENLLKALTADVYEARSGRKVNPEGKFDSATRWYPSVREDADGSGSQGRSPSRAWPYSYMTRCRTRQHARVLVERALAGQDVPDDVARVLKSKGALEMLALIHVPK